MNILVDLFKTFFKIGMVTFGGGYAMIPIIETEVTEKHQWMKKEELLDLIAIAQSCPGVFAINISTFIGYKLYKRKGAACAALATALPSFFIILIIAMFFHQFEDNKVVAAIFRGIRPAVVALIAVPTFNLAKSAKINLSNCWIPIGITHHHYPGGRTGWLCLWSICSTHRIKADCHDLPVSVHHVL